MRLFVAVNLPSAEKKRLALLLDTLQKSEASVRWLDAESLHITMKFLGDVADAASLNDALDRAAASVPPFDLEIAGFGAFPSPSRPRIFWLGVQAPPQLLELQRNIEAELEKLGYAREDRPFSPHITMGRARNGQRVERAAMDRMTSQVEYKTVLAVRSVDLMRSHLGQSGARYELLHAAPLKNR